MKTLRSHLVDSNNGLDGFFMKRDEGNVELRGKLSPRERRDVMFVLNAQIKGDVLPDKAYFEVYYSVKHLLSLMVINGKTKAAGGLRPEVRFWNGDDAELLELDGLHRAESMRRTQSQIAQLEKMRDSLTERESAGVEVVEHSVEEVERSDRLYGRGFW